jgi:hypothetical protein
MKTAIQEAIKIIEERLKILSTVQITEPTIGAIAGYQYSKYLLMELLKKEKEQMLDFGLYVKKNGWVGCKIEDLYEDYNNQNK